MIKCKKSLALIVMLYGYIGFSSAIAMDNLQLGTAGVQALSIEKERDLGAYFITAARSQLPIIYDPVLQKYLDGLVGRLATKAQGVHYPFESFITNDSTVNAAAFFGGKIMVHSGLFLVSESESELASVLAHEMTHVTQRHLARMMEQMQAASNLGIAGIIGGIILSIINPAAGMASVATAIGGLQQARINYTREHEYEADRLGIDLLYRANFNPYGMSDMMRVLQSLSDKINPAFEMFMTHPLTQKRVAEAENRARQFSPRAYYESIDFSFAKSRVEVRYSSTSPTYNLQIANTSLARNARNYGALYKKALALFELKRYQEALDAIELIEKTYPKNLFVIDTKSDILLGLKQHNNAIAYLNKHIESIGENPVIMINLAATYVENKDYNHAERILKRINREEYSIVANELLMKIYRLENDVCSLYQLNTSVYEYKGQWDLALNNAREAIRKCSEKNAVLKMQAQMGRIVTKRNFYQGLLNQ